MYKKLVLSVALGSTLLMSGCVAFRANNLAEVSPNDLQFAAANKTKVFSRWSVESNSTMVNDQMKAAGAAIHKKYFDDAISATNCCVIVEGPAEADVVVDGKAFNENSPAAILPAFITGFSLFTIPSWATAKVHIAAQVKSAGATRAYDLQDSMTMVQWLPMIFAMPFVDNPMKAGKLVDENTYRTLVLRMKTDGLLK